MRDPNRIDNILYELGKIWKENPDLRLGQMITNLLIPDYRLYHMEDNELIKELKTYYCKKEQNKVEEK